MIHYKYNIVYTQIRNTYYNIFIIKNYTTKVPIKKNIVFNLHDVPISLLNQVLNKTI